MLPRSAGLLVTLLLAASLSGGASGCAGAASSEASERDSYAGSGHFGSVRGALLRAAERHARRTPTVERPRVLADLASAAIDGGDSRRALRLAADALAGTTKTPAATAATLDRLVDVLPYAGSGGCSLIDRVARAEATPRADLFRAAAVEVCALTGEWPVALHHLGRIEDDDPSLSAAIQALAAASMADAETSPPGLGALHEAAERVHSADLRAEAIASVLEAALARSDEPLAGHLAAALDALWSTLPAPLAVIGRARLAVVYASMGRSDAAAREVAAAQADVEQSPAVLADPRVSTAMTRAVVGAGRLPAWLDLIEAQRDPELEVGVRVLATQLAGRRAGSARELVDAVLREELAAKRARLGRAAVSALVQAGAAREARSLVAHIAAAAAESPTDVAASLVVEAALAARELDAARAAIVRVSAGDSARLYARLVALTLHAVPGSVASDELDRVRADVPRAMVQALVAGHLAAAGRRHSADALWSSLPSATEGRENPGETGAAEEASLSVAHWHLRGGRPSAAVAVLLRHARSEAEAARLLAGLAGRASPSRAATPALFAELRSALRDR